LSELEQETVLAADVEITDLDLPGQRSRPVMRWRDGQRLLPRTRLWMGLGTMLGVAVLCLLVVGSLHLTGAAQLEKSSTQPIVPAAREASPLPEQVVIVGRFVYTLNKDGLVSVQWSRHRNVYVIWQQHVAPASQLLRVDQEAVYIATPNGNIIALRSSDGTLLWTITMQQQESLSEQANLQAPLQSGAAWLQGGGTGSDAR
jgi:hypothetical protein